MNRAQQTVDLLYRDKMETDAQTQMKPSVANDINNVRMTIHGNEISSTGLAVGEIERMRRQVIESLSVDFGSLKDGNLKDALECMDAALAKQTIATAAADTDAQTFGANAGGLLVQSDGTSPFVEGNRHAYVEACEEEEEDVV
ncbi:hypothetical protein DOTSEDRAFT_75721 [Dothistroma septosporum NZE10]|uniref:Uncharacterized protein n=1 Tax=Dothistroma septosporum (strain NZE10 / CBS 128990) TaxID=675120 RepID=N1PBY6_DOTSN|nr:hypothetical protein DOTSEDRAFT_75721 [Dothistroma septosporum NZE10]